MKRVRGLLTGFLALGLLLGAVPSASASFHIMKIREVSGGAPASGLSYVELQMYASFQTLVDGHSIAIYDADGQTDGDPAVDPVEACVIDGVLPNSSLNGDNQRTILVGDASLTGADAVCDEADDLDPLEAGGVAAASGAVCFSDGSPPDCVSWGGFPGGPASISFDNATPFGGALPSTNALKRKISGGSCATLLDFSDDTNDTNVDFESVARDPTPNNVPPVETPCMSQPPIPPGGGGSTTPAAPKKKKCKKPKKRSAAAAKKKCKKKKK